MVILGFADYRPQAQRLAQSLAIPYLEARLHRFPDGESKVTVPAELPEHVIVCRSLDQPNAKLIELMFTVDALRRQKVTRITLVTPYLCYMRQDAVFVPGEALSQLTIGRFLASLVDTLVTVDPHLHRIERLEEALPVKTLLQVSATPLFADAIAARFTDPLLVGPDAESEQWVRAVAAHLPTPADYCIGRKLRSGDRDVEVSFARQIFSGRDVVLIDDIASTGHTLAKAAQAISPHSPRSLSALVTHALFDTEAGQRLSAAGIQHIVSSDSISHASSQLELAPVLAAAIGRWCNSTA